MRVRQLNLCDFIARVMIDNSMGREIGPTSNEHLQEGGNS